MLVLRKCSSKSLLCPWNQGRGCPSPDGGCGRPLEDRTPITGALSAGVGASCCVLRRPGNGGHTGRAGAADPGLCFPGSLSLGVPRPRGLAQRGHPQSPRLPPSPNPGRHTFLQLLLASLSEDSSLQVTRETRRHSNRDRLAPPAARSSCLRLSPGRWERQAAGRPCPGLSRPPRSALPSPALAGASVPSALGTRERRPRSHRSV